MRASHVVLLSLAASAAVPVFAAPLPYVIFTTATVMTHLADLPILNSYLKSRSDDGFASLSARDFPDSYTEARSHHVPDVVDRHITRDVTSGSPAARDTTGDLFKAMLEDRAMSLGQDIQTRGLYSGLFDVGIALLSQFLRRDVSPDDLLAARDGAKDFINSITDSHHLTPEKRIQARDDGLARLINVLASRRAVASASDELSARDNSKGLVEILNTRELGF